jgi:D-3-phosphoglycerate dehydrogenase
MDTKRPSGIRTVVPDDFPAYILRSTLEPLRKYGEVVIYDTKASSSDELAERLTGAAAVINIRSYSKFPREVLEKLKPSLKIISVLGTGVDHIDLVAASQLGITISNTPDVSTEAVAEHALALMLAAAKDIPAIHNETKGGRWVRSTSIQLYGKTLGVIGTGYIGRQVARLGRGIGMEVVAWTLHPSSEVASRLGIKFVPLDELLRTSDVVSINLRLSLDTAGLIGRRELSLMKPTAIIINTARGAIIDQKALVEALKEGRIAGAGLDVFEQEPIPPDDPILKLDNVILSPHNASSTPEVVEKSSRRSVENVIAFLEGKPANVVNG